MNEEEEQQGEEVTTEDSNDGDKPEVYKPIDDANLAAKRLEDANKEKKDLLDREEELEAKKALGGQSQAGTNDNKPTFTEDEKASRARIKAVADASGSPWGKKYE